MHPLRPKLMDTVVSEIRDGIIGGTWGKWLPQERTLAKDLKVSRGTLRQALKLLRREGLIESLHSKGHLVRRPKRSKDSKGVRPRMIVNLITPGSSAEPRLDNAMPWPDILRGELADEGFDLRVIEAKSCYSGHPDRSLERLVNRYPADCWVMRISTLPMQRWFEERGIPAVVAGTSYPDVTLPFVGVDRHAMCRHATFAAVGAGHRDIALLIDRAVQGGDIETKKGFDEAIAASQMRHGEISGLIGYCDGTVQGVVRQLARLHARESPPTVIIVAQPMYYLSVVTYLAQNNLHVPKNISLLAQIEAPFFAYLLPRPSCYRVKVPEFARMILAAIVDRLKGRQPKGKRYVIVPEFIVGGSLDSP